MRSSDEVRLDYAWGWFAYHASQRFSAFNFFVVVVGALTVAYANSASHHSRIVSAAVGLLGALMAIGFTAIDVRNADLVDCGRKELRDVEPTFYISITASAKQTRHRYASHGLWLRMMILAFGVLSIVGAVWAIADPHFGY